MELRRVIGVSRMLVGDHRRDLCREFRIILLARHLEGEPASGRDPDAVEAEIQSRAFPGKRFPDRGKILCERKARSLRDHCFLFLKFFFL